MSKKRGLSVEEKRNIILGIFHESNTCWLLKDIEKAANKAGVVLQTVKDIIAGLVSDDLVVSDKIGTSNYFWSLKSEHANKVRKQRAKLEAALAAAEASRDEMGAKAATARAARPDTEERTAAAAALAAAQTRHVALKAELAKHAGNDPETLKLIADMKPIALEAANRWTDNMFLLKDWMQKAGIDSSNIGNFFKQQADINIDELEYVTEEGLLAKLRGGGKSAKAGKSGKSGKSSGGGKKRKAEAEAEP